jgi:hypothetical protein
MLAGCSHDSRGPSMVRGRVKECKNLKKADLTNLSTTGYNVEQYYLIENESLFRNIQNKVIEQFKRYMNNDFKLKSSWTILGEENSYHTVHKHHDAINFIASVLYLEVPPNPDIHRSGGFYYFLNRNKGKGIKNLEIYPQIGDLIFMPVHILHGSYPQSKGLRQTLNMDFEVI